MWLFIYFMISIWAYGALVPLKVSYLDDLSLDKVVLFLLVCKIFYEGNTSPLHIYLKFLDKDAFEF